MCSCVQLCPITAAALALKSPRLVTLFSCPCQKPLGLKQDRVPQPFSYMRDINTYQSTDSKIYIQQISPSTGFHVCLHVSIGTIKNKVVFFFHSTLEYPFSFRKIFNNLISLSASMADFPFRKRKF